VSAVSGERHKLSGANEKCGFADGNSHTSQFRAPSGLALSSDEKTLYVCDWGNNRIRAIDTASGDTRTVAGSGNSEHLDGIGSTSSIHAPNFCDWDRASNIEPFTFLYVTARNTVRRLNVKTGQMTTLKCPDFLNPCGIVCLSGSGIIVISCTDTHCLWTIDSRTNAIERLAGAVTRSSSETSMKSQQIEGEDPLSVRFGCPVGIAWHKSDRSILVVDEFAHTVVRVPLSDRL
jgi:sugar lactone lactonase YvrE